MPLADISRQDLFKACESLFGTEIDISIEFLRYLKPAGVKAAYRKKAMETHPDRAAALAGRADFMEDLQGGQPCTQCVRISRSPLEIFPQRRGNPV